MRFPLGTPPSTKGTGGGVPRKVGSRIFRRVLTMLLRTSSTVLPQRRLTLTRRALLHRSTAAVAMVTGILQIQGCTRPAAGLPPIEDPVVGEYHLGPGDQVRIITFGEEQLTGEFRVDASGDIALPLVGNVHAAGRTPPQLEAATKEVLVRSRLYKNPSVSVEVINYRPIFILGEVTRPGQYPYQPGMTVLTAVAIGGGFTYRAVDDLFSIVRTIDGKTTEGRAGRETLAQPGDVITVYERRF
jgi:polysaccharide biosynthesis/export protein